MQVSCNGFRNTQTNKQMQNLEELSNCNYSKNKFLRDFSRSIVQSFTRVPGVVAADPREDSVEGGEQVEKCPGQDHDVVCHHVNGDHLIPVADTFHQTWYQALRLQNVSWAPLAMLPYKYKYLPLKDKFSSNMSPRPDPSTGPRMPPGRSRGFRRIPGKKRS